MLITNNANNLHAPFFKQYIENNIEIYSTLTLTTIQKSNVNVTLFVKFSYSEQTELQLGLNLVSTREFQIPTDN